MSKWSNDEKVEAAFDLMEGSFCGDGFMRRVGGKLLDLRERAEKAEKRADEHFGTILAMNKHEIRASKELSSLDTTCRELTKRLAASEQRCAALEAALASAKERCGDIFSGKVEDEALGDVVVALGAALSGDTSALRDMLDAAICTVLRKQLNKEWEGWSWDDISSVVTSAVLRGEAANL